MKLLVVSVIVAALMTIMVAFVNFSREGIAAFEDGLLIYVGYFVLIVFLILIATFLTDRFGRK